MWSCLPVVFLFEQSNLLLRQNAAHLIVQLVHRGGIERAPGGMHAREAVDHRLNLLLLSGHEAE
jgi:hypothetical protein